MFRTVVPETLFLQLDPGLPDGTPPGGKGRQQHIRHADPRYGNPPGVRAYSPAVIPVHLTTAWPCTTTTPSLSLQMTVLGLITDDDDTVYREDVRDQTM